MKKAICILNTLKLSLICILDYPPLYPILCSFDSMEDWAMQRMKLFNDFDDPIEPTVASIRILECLYEIKNQN